ncbi:hypothetical protein RvY_07067 [Ramazzottius varieornatus]|uniref:Uncharacterized protein n=1 Tax=Ramazzottius varieornatus TaxID=947166 RepID=A0A1D1V5Y1_RAMVA|nr:hypothetical protein RvY_07067 [Ramazzottius varieornatus]
MAGNTLQRAGFLLQEQPRKSKAMTRESMRITHSPAKLQTVPGLPQDQIRIEDKKPLFTSKCQDPLQIEEFSKQE